MEKADGCEAEEASVGKKDRCKETLKVPSVLRKILHTRQSRGNMMGKQIKKLT